MKTIIFTLFALLVYGQFAQAADVYRWIDNEGKTHYTDRPENIPREYRKKKESINIDPRRPISSDDTGEALFKPPTKPQAEPDTKGSDKNRPKVFVAPLYSSGGGGSFMVDTRFNNLYEKKLVLDTGASMLVITKKLASEMGVGSVLDLPKIPVVTAGGGSWIYLTSFDTVAVGGAVAHDVVAGISLDLDPGFGGLLGMTYLNDFIYQIDGLSRKLILKRGNDGEKMYGGMPRSWWMLKYRDIVGNLKKYKKLEKAAASTGSNNAEKVLAMYPGMTLEHFSKLANFYQRLFTRLDRRASSAGVPNSWRLYP